MLKGASMPPDCNYAKFVTEINFITTLKYSQKKTHATVKKWQKVLP